MAIRIIAKPDACAKLADGRGAGYNAPDKSGERVKAVIKWDKDQALASVLWGAVAAAGEFTMLFLTVIGRIHVSFVNEAPVFSVDPRGPIRLTKDTALASVWAMTIAYGLLVTALVYVRPRLSRRLWVTAGIVAVALAVVAALAEPWWGLIVLADFVALYPALSARGPDEKPLLDTEK
jgi:hypothetical protein